MIPLTFFIVGPVVGMVSYGLAQATLAVYEFSPILTAIVLGGPWILIVMFGLHWAFIPIFINNFMTLGYDPINGLLAANQFAMAGAALAVAVKTRDAKLKTLAGSTGVTSLLGVSEPALYGVLLPLKKPLVMGIIGGSIGSIVAAVCGTKSFAAGAAGVFSIPTYINPKGIDIGFYGSVGSMILGFLAAFLLTFFLGYKNKADKDLTKKKALNNTYIG
jgi:beta-glucoside PTS system EIICBA component